MPHLRAVRGHAVVQQCESGKWAFDQLQGRVVGPPTTFTEPLSTKASQRPAKYLRSSPTTTRTFSGCGLPPCGADHGDELAQVGNQPLAVADTSHRRGSLRHRRLRSPQQQTQAAPTVVAELTVLQHCRAPTELLRYCGRRRAMARRDGRWETSSDPNVLIGVYAVAVRAC